MPIKAVSANVLLTIVLMSIGSVVAQNVSSAEQFWQKSGLVEGDYTLTTQGESSCLEGNLHIIKIDDGALTLMFGFRPLITDIGRDLTNKKEAGCSITTRVTVNPRQVRGITQEKCGDDLVSMETDLNAQDKGLRYTRETTFMKNGNKKVLKETCTYHYGENPDEPKQ